MKTHQIIVKDDVTGKEVVYDFDTGDDAENARLYSEKIREICRDYAVHQSHTLTSLVVERKQDLFGG